MGDPLREAAFDAAYEILGDVGEAEEAATAAVTRIRRRRRRTAGVGVAAAVLFAIASAVALVGNGGATDRVVHAADTAPAPGAVEKTTTEPATTTTVVLMQPPLETPAPAAATATRPTTATTARSAAPTTSPTTTAAATAPSPAATLAEVFPPARDPRRTYVAARGQDARGYVQRMSIDWGDGSPATSFDYPMSSCATGVLQAANADHAYATPGSYTVRLIVTSVRCDGSDERSATAEKPVSYSSVGG